MEIASITHLKNELKNLPPEELLNICIRLAKYKKENKELLHYLLFESMNESAFVELVKQEIDEQFSHLNRSSFYLAKKTLRKVLKTTRKYIRFSNSKQTEIELLIYFCQKMKESGLRMRSSRTVTNLYARQVERIKKVLAMLHEDLQFDYHDTVKAL